MNSIKITGTDYVGQLEKTVVVEANKVLGFDAQKEPVMTTGGGGSQIYEDYHQALTPPADPAKPAFSIDTSTGAVFQWRTILQTWV